MPKTQSHDGDIEIFLAMILYYASVCFLSTPHLLKSKCFERDIAPFRLTVFHYYDFTSEEPIQKESVGDFSQTFS